VKKRGSIYRKYVVLVVALVAGALLVSGLAGMYNTYTETRANLLAVEREHAVAASIRIENFVDKIVTQIDWLPLPDSVTSKDPQKRRFDYIKLLKEVKEITEATYIDANGHEQVRESRIGMSAYGSGKDLSGDPRFKAASTGRTYFGPVIFRKETEPYMAIAEPIEKRYGGGVTAVDVNLKFMWEVIRSIHVGKTGFAYVVDRRGRLIAHPDISLVLQKTDLASLPQVRAALAQGDKPGATPQRAGEARDPAGKSVLSAYARIDSLGWTVFVEQSIDEAYRPLYASLIRTGGLLVAGLLLSMVAGFVFARRMVEPIRALQEGADAIGAGDLSKRIAVHTGDELEGLGERFNEMAGKLAASYAGLERKVEERTQELRQALEFQSASGDILSSISGSIADSQPVFDAIVQNLLRLFDTRFVVVQLLRDGRVEIAAQYGNEGFKGLTQNYPRPLDDSTIGGLVMMTGQVTQLTPVIGNPDAPPATVEFARSYGFDSLIAAPMAREGKVIGAIVTAHRDARPFDEKQVALIKTFADQAVIAIENARLFNETKEALEQQTATAEILRAISASPSDVAPVFEAILESATRLCDGPLAAVFRYEDGLVHLAAYRNWSPSVIEEMKKDYPAPPSDKLMSGRTILSGRLQHEEDAYNDPEYDHNVAAAGGWRRMVGVPIKHSNRVLGAIAFGWPMPGKTPERQVRLLETFAEQAAIAIENVRLFNETKEALERQTATAEILQVISGSPTDVQPVFDSIARRAVQLCDSLFANLFRYDGEQLYFVASQNVAPEQLEIMADRYPMPPDLSQVSGRVVLRNAIVRMEDALADSTYDHRFAEVGGWRRMLGVPMVREGRILGAIVVGWRDAGPVSPAHEVLLKTFADQAAIAIENVRLFHEIEEKSRQLEIANKHKSDFLANMSHELRTPLNAIIGFSEVLIEKMFGEVNDKQLDYLHDIHGSGKHLLSLINDILDLSKIEAGRMELDVVDVNVPDTLSSAMTLVRERAQNHGIELALDVDPQINVIQADERKVKQVVLNLLSNAVKFTPDGGSVAVRATLDTDHVAVAVRDTGIGIAPEDQEAVFEEFKQVGRDYTKKAEGTGLGLALTRRIVELHGGRIWLESAPGKGSTFTFTLPLTQQKGVQ
jgi:signal transduction histidine kinase